MTESILNPEEKVRFILEMYPETRNSDNKLIYWYIRVFTDMRIFDDLRESNISFATIMRKRRKIQNQDGDFLPTDRVQKIRDEKESDHKFESFMR